MVLPRHHTTGSSRTDSRRAGLRGASMEEQLLGHRLPRLLHAGDGRGSRLCLVPEPMEPVRLAVLMRKRFKAGEHARRSPQAIVARRNIMSAQEMTSTNTLRALSMHSEKGQY